MTSDEQAVKAALAGDVRAFERLVDRYFGLVYMIAYAHLADRQASEDLAQEVFLRAWLHLEKVEPPSRFAAWLSQIARNLACDWLKRGQRASALIAKVPDSEWGGEIVDPRRPDPSQESERREMHEALHNAILRLPVEQREVVLLHYAEQLGKKEIAERLGVHPGTVGRQIDRALGKLRGSLERMLGEAAPALKPPRAAIARTMALVAAAAALSPAAKAAVVQAVLNTAEAAASSVAGSGSVAGTGGAAGALSGGMLAGVKTVMTVKLASGIVAVGLLVMGGYYYFDAYGRPAPIMPAKVVAPVTEAKAEPAGVAEAAPPPPQQPEPAGVVAEPSTSPPAPPPERKPAATVGPAPEEGGLDLTTPKGTVTSFTRMVGKKDWKKVIDCFLPGGVDYQDTLEIANATPENRHAYQIKLALEAIDPDKPAEAVSTQELPDGQMKVIWHVTLKTGFALQRRVYAAGDTMEYDATLRRTEDGRWLIDNF